MDSLIDLTRSLPAEVWAQVLECLDVLSIHDWRTLMLVSTFWRNVVSRQVRNIYIFHSWKTKTKSSSFPAAVCANLRSIRMLPPLPLNHSSSPYVLDMNWIASVVPLFDLMKLEEVVIVGCERVIDLDLFLSRAKAFPNMRRLDISGVGDWEWPSCVMTALGSWSSLRSLSFASSGDDGPANRVISSLSEQKPKNEWLLKLDGVETLKIDSVLRLRNLSLPNLTSLSLCFPAPGHLSLDGRTFSTLFSAFQHLQTLDISESGVGTLGLPSGAASYFPTLSSLKWKNAKVPIMLDFILRLPSLEHLVTTGSHLVPPPVRSSSSSSSSSAHILSPHVHDHSRSYVSQHSNDELPMCKSLLHWTLSPYGQDFSFAVLQLVPNLVHLHVMMGYLNPLRVEKLSHFLNSHPSLSRFGFTHDFLFSDEKLAPCISRVSFGNRLTWIDFSASALKGGCLALYSTFTPHLSSLILRDCRHFEAFHFKHLLVWKNLVQLDLAGTQALRTTDLSDVIAKLSTLTDLNISHIKSIWTAHLRLLEPLRDLSRLAHVLHDRGGEFASFHLVKGLWPKLHILVLEITSPRNCSILADVFGPLVKVVHEGMPTCHSTDS